LCVHAHLIARAAFVVHTARIRHHTSVQAANLTSTAREVVRAAVGASTAIAYPGADALVVVHTYRRLAADPCDAVDV